MRIHKIRLLLVVLVLLAVMLAMPALAAAAPVDGGGGIGAWTPSNYLPAFLLVLFGSWAWIHILKPIIGEGRRRPKVVIMPLTILLMMTMVMPALAEGESVVWTFPIDLTSFFEALFGVLAALITAKVIPWIKSKTTAQQQETLQTVTRTLVYAAEQLYGSDKGKKKLQYVKDKLTEKGFTVDIDAIEAAVRELSLYGRLMTETTVIEDTIEASTEVSEAAPDA